MALHCKLFPTLGYVLVVAAAAAIEVTVTDAQAADMTVRPSHRAFAATKSATIGASKAAEITGTLNVRASHAPLTVAASHARTARARFTEARAAMERGLLLRESASKADIAALEAAMQGLFYEMKILENLSRSAAPIGKATSLAQDWYQAGLKIIRPPAEGLVELPLPMTVRSKADAAAA